MRRPCRLDGMSTAAGRPGYPCRPYRYGTGTLLLDDVTRLIRGRRSDDRPPADLGIDGRPSCAPADLESYSQAHRRMAPLRHCPCDTLGSVPHGSELQDGTTTKGGRHMTDPRSLLEVDARKRVSLGVLAAYDRYLVDVEDDGTIILTPAVVMSVVEARLHAATEVATRIDEFLDNPTVGSRRRRPSGPPAE